MVEKNKLFVGNLDHGIRWFHLKEFFAKFGEVTYTKVVFDRETKKSRGFGFVVFATDEQAEKALNEGNGAFIETQEASFMERPIRLMYAQAMEPRAESQTEETQTQTKTEDASSTEAVVF